MHAWSDGDVPHYVTSNTSIAQAYAELLLAFFRDRARLQPVDEPFYIVELGAGSGRFSYHLLKALITLCEQAMLPAADFVYVMTDFVEDTLVFWEAHPRFIPLIERGIVDTAFFDAEKSTGLYLRKSKKTIDINSLSQPLIVIANYFFDSIPQELFYIDGGSVQNVLIEAEQQEETEYTTAKEALEKLAFKYVYEEAGVPSFKDPVQNLILKEYQATLQNSHLLFPHTGLDCISRLQALSSQGLMLITADKGYHRIDELHNLQAPSIIKHGSFSLSSNYHAFKEHCSRLGGRALFTKHPHAHIEIGCLLYVKDAEEYNETQLAYIHNINDFGPDEYFTIKKHLDKHAAYLSVKEMYAFLRLSGCDARLFQQFIPRFRARKQEFTEEERYTFLQMAATAWEGYYPIGENEDLAFDIATLLHELGFYTEALSFFLLSQQLYGKTTDLLYNTVTSYIALGNIGQAKLLLHEILQLAPGSKEALELLEAMAGLE